MPGTGPENRFHKPAAVWPTNRLRLSSGNASRPKHETRLDCLCGLLLLAGGAAAQDGGKTITKTTISLGTATPGGGFPVYGNAFAEIMNAADPALSIEPRNTKGSNENIPLLESRPARHRAGGGRAFL